MTNSINGLDGAQELLVKLVEQNPEDWETRKQVVQVLYDAEFYRDASKMVWSAPEIPPVGKEVIFAARVVSKGQPTRAMRLFDTIIEKNMAHPNENLAMAKLLVKASMPYQAIRFYGAATALDSSLIDEDFELSLVAADSGRKNWNEFVASDEFPWDGPDLSEEEELKAAEARKADSYAELLNGATQPVPMKAPVRDQEDRSGGADRHKTLPTWKVGSNKATFDPNEILGDRKSTNGSNGSESKAAMPDRPGIQAEDDGPNNIIQHDELEQALEVIIDDASTKPTNGADKVNGAEVTNGASKEKEVSAEADKPKTPELPKIEKPKVEQPKAKELKTDQPKAELPKKKQVDAKSVKSTDEEKDSKANGAFFKSYDDAHDGKQSEDAKAKGSSKASSLPSAGKSTPSAKIKIEGDESSSSSPVSKAQPQKPSNKKVVKSESSEKQSKGFLGGMFSSLFGKGGDKSASKLEPVIDVDDLDLSGVESSSVKSDSPTKVVKKPVVPAPTLKKASVDDKVATQQVISKVKPAKSAPEPKDETPKASEPETKAAQAKPMTQIPIASPMKAQAAAPVNNSGQQSGPSVPRELDGRTQLVSLAPEDGTAFFSELSGKYRALAGSGNMPRPAELARDMANVDYLDLIEKACSKDLDAFSKLLGLHRVMHNAGCGEWVEDMNLLRKGYGDAVLATVVSKYSVNECREILNSVYTYPTREAAAV